MYPEPNETAASYRRALSERYDCAIPAECRAILAQMEATERTLRVAAIERRQQNELVTEAIVAHVERCLLGSVQA